MNFLRIIKTHKPVRLDSAAQSFSVLYHKTDLVRLPAFLRLYSRPLCLRLSPPDKPPSGFCNTVITSLKVVYSLQSVRLMGDIYVKKEPTNEDTKGCLITLTMNQRTICRTRCFNPPFQAPVFVSVRDMVRQERVNLPARLPRCTLLCAPENSHQEKEWGSFLTFLQKNKKVAIAMLEFGYFYIYPPCEGSNFSQAFALYQEKRRQYVDIYSGHGGIAGTLSEQKDQLIDAKTQEILQFDLQWRKTCPPGKPESPSGNNSHPEVVGDVIRPICKVSNAVRDQTCHRKTKIKCENKDSVSSHDSMKRNHVQVHPSYLTTLGQTHSGWIFGAIAEFVDNSRDAKASRLDISINLVYFKSVGKDIPMLSIVDDGHGMTHEEIVRMISFGHKPPETDDSDRIGKFGIGFKTGAMKLGKDALVLSQTETSRSIAFLSQSLNEGKDNLEIPIVSYCKIGQYMEIDTSVQDECLAKSNLRTIKEFSPFDKYLIGEKAGIFNEKGTGTQIYIWDLEKWGSNYSLEWVAGMVGGSSFHHGDILIRSRRIRSRPSQICRTVPLDYSLRSYLGVMFFDPRMKIHVQGAQVKAPPLAKCLHNTVVENGTIMGKPVQLILGRCQLEWELANCGIFLYWHGRLIEAYKRVGSMIHNGDVGRGIIGVIDLTDLMKDDDGLMFVHNNKQGFLDCEAYAELEKWLGERADSYLDNYVNTVQLERTSVVCKPDNEWVQCDKCRKWRMLSTGFNSKTLPPEWFCYMKPFNGRCDMPEQKVENGVVTISVKRSREDYSRDENKSSEMSKKGDRSVLQDMGVVEIIVRVQRRMAGNPSKNAQRSVQVFVERDDFEFSSVYIVQAFPHAIDQREKLERWKTCGVPAVTPLLS